MEREPRGLRFPFEAGAEIIPEESREPVPARVTELSLRGCYMETTAVLTEKQRVRIKILRDEEYFEGYATVIYVRPNGVGLVYAEMKPHFRGILQNWLLSALDQQVKLTHS